MPTAALALPANPNRLTALKTKRCEYRHVVAEGEERCKYRHPIVRDDMPADPRVGYLDIESSHLDAPFGIVYSWAIKEMDGAMQSHLIHERSIAGEKRVLEALVTEMRKYDWLITWYGTKFDIPFIRARCMYHGIDFPKPGEIYHLDLYYQAKSKIKMSRFGGYRLASVSQFLDCEGKLPLKAKVWVKASFGDRKSLEYILAHNKEDVNVLEAVHKKFIPHIRPMRRSV